MDQRTAVVPHLDDVAQTRVEVVAVHPPCCLADVDAQIGGALNIGNDLDG